MISAINGNGSWFSPKTVLQLGPVTVIALLLVWFLIKTQDAKLEGMVVMHQKILEAGNAQIANQKEQNLTERRILEELEALNNHLWRNDRFSRLDTQTVNRLRATD